jgi:uncharacterized protein (DUF1015 family)
MPLIAGFRGVIVDPTKKLTDISASVAKGELQRDATRALYRYHQIFKHPDEPRTVTRRSFFAAVRLAPWGDPSVRGTEAVEPARRDAALAELASTSTELAPVLGGYRDAAGEVERLLRRFDGDRPVLEVTVDGVIHRLWRIKDAEVFGKVRSTLGPKKVQILEGADRYDAMLAHETKLDAQSSLAPHSTARYGLMCLTAIDDPALLPAARHRVLRGNVKSDAMAGLKPQFIVDKLAGVAGDAAQLRNALALDATVAHQPAFVVVFKGEPDAWKLTLSPDVTATTEGVAIHRALHRLDPIIVDTLFVSRVAKDATVTTETTVDGALAAVKAGADAAVMMRPVTAEQMIHVGDLGQLLPASSIAFYPPVLPLVAYLIEPDLDAV